MTAQIQTKALMGDGKLRSYIKSFLRKQPMMRRVLVSLIPIITFSIYSHGWRVFSVLALVTVAGVVTEYIFEKSRNGKPSESILVSCFLYTLILPVTVPYWIAVVGIIFAVVFGKQVFGGFARNVFNPAILGRVFVFITFPAAMTNSWTHPFTGFPGGFVKWVPELTDGISSTTPLAAVAKGGMLPTHLQLFLGNIPGSMGETSVILILIAAIYLIIRKTASWRIIVSVLAGVLGMETILYLSGVSRFPDPLYAILSGGVLFGAVFMATDPITAPSTDPGKWIFGLLVGIVAVFIREFSLFQEGMMFAILIMNSFVPLLDIVVKSVKNTAAKRRVAT